ncbi:AAA family ATPase [Streptomyces sp.]|uniref:AAA family ATPase n=1 Tax=Streptomyces sp. TaxID=1931 RepID=UPI0039C9B09A
MSSLESACAAQSGAVPRQTPVSARSGGRDLRGTAAVRVLRFRAGDRVVVSGLPGSGKSTLIRRVVAAHETVIRIDSQDMRERWERRLPAWLPYGVYRPLVRIAHYLALWRALASGAGVVVHDCGTQSWVRRWLARDARRRGRALHMVLLDVPPQVALSGQAQRGRGVSAYAFARHRRAVGRLVADVEAGRLPRGCVSAVLLDRTAAGALRGIVFG